MQQQEARQGASAKVRKKASTAVPRISVVQDPSEEDGGGRPAFASLAVR